MFGVSKIIEKNLHRLKSGGSALWIHPEKDDCWQSVNTKCRSLKLFSQEYTCYNRLKKTGANIEFAAFPQPDVNKYDWIIINLYRQKALLGMMLDCAASLLAKDGVLWLAGENKAGIKSADKLLKKRFGHIVKLDNARHCSLYEAGTGLSHGQFTPLSYRHQWTLSRDNHEIDVVSYPGVFAHGRVDEGTALLLDVLSEMALQGDVLDFACGAGIIGAFIAARHTDTRVTLLDSNALALKACRETLETNQLHGCVQASDGLSELSGSFDLVVSNPPIHSDVRTDNRLGMRLLENIGEHIRAGGKLILVANVHLPYENWLSKTFRKISVLATNDNYKVIASNN